MQLYNGLHRAMLLQESWISLHAAMLELLIKLLQYRVEEVSELDYNSYILYKLCKKN